MNEKEKSPAAIVQATAEALGLTFGQTTAARAHVIAEHILDEQPSEVVLALVADGVAVHLAKLISRKRRSTEDATKRAALEAAAGRRVIQLPLLDYPLVMPGERQMLVRHATLNDIRVAATSISMQRRGLEKTERMMNDLIAVLHGMPENRTVERLLEEGVLVADDLLVSSGKSA